MYRIVERQTLNPTVTRLTVDAPRVAAKAQPGQFIILRTHAEGERIPLTIADADPVAGTVTVIFQVVGATTIWLNQMRQGDALADFVGPLGVATYLDGIRRAIVVGGGVGTAISYPIAKKLHAMGAEVHTVNGFRNRDLVILQREFEAISDHFLLMTDDGSVGRKGLVTDALEELLQEGECYDRVFAIGPLVMMKFVSQVTKKYKIPTTVSMNPIMIDGTGMCGCCRLTVDGVTRFACVDGPDFDAEKVDFDEAIWRASMYRKQEVAAREAMCKLYKIGGAV